MSDFTKDNYRSILDGIIHIVQKAAEVFESAQNWYQKNAEKINEYLTLFADFSWMIHGRTRREYTNLDFIKTILWLDAIIFLDDKLTDHKEVKEL